MYSEDMSDSKQQVVVIHGADSFPTYEKYLEALREYEVDLADLSRRGWKDTLGEKLGEEYKVLYLKMPNKQNAKYLEWKIWFEKWVPLLRDGAILVGHSMGGVFLAKYLSEESFPKSIRATFLVAAPFNDEAGRPLVEFTLPVSLESFERQGGQIYIYHSEDDRVVAFSETEKYKETLPSATLRVFEDRGHFNAEELPELVSEIQSLS